MSWNDLLNLILRWVHLIAGIAWIGSSFYFIWLDSSLERSDEDPAVEGRLWMVHSGGFYRVERRRIGPGQMPDVLHWFKWEAAFTWMSGIALLVVVYYLTGGIYLLDPAVSGISLGAATAIGLALPIVAWLVYDGLWRSPLARKPWIATALSLALLALMVVGLTRLLSGRAAWIHVGVVIGTIMVANVWMRILPAQQRMIDATKAGRTPDFTLSDAAKRRSVHNSYVTFPILAIMLSNHFPALYGSRFSAVVLLLLAVAGGSARHVMIGRPPGRNWALVPAVASIVGVFLLTAAPASLGTAPLPGATGPAPAFTEVQAIVQSRCLACHSQTPHDPTFGVAPGGVSFDDPAAIRKLAPRIYVRAVVSKTMPLANKTGITDPERALLGRWVEHGAPGP